MENASKALIIAGAILISILIISFGVMIIGGVSDKMKPDMSEAEIASYNGDFEQGEGSNVRGSNVKTLLKKAKLHNQANKDDASKIVVVDKVTSMPTKVDYSDEKEGSIVKRDGTEGDDYEKILSGKSYEVKCFYAPGGLVFYIAVMEKTT